jgi:hypothetical protein
MKLKSHHFSVTDIVEFDDDHIITCSSEGWSVCIWDLSRKDDNKLVEKVEEAHDKCKVSGLLRHEDMVLSVGGDMKV